MLYLRTRKLAEEIVINIAQGQPRPHHNAGDFEDSGDCTATYFQACLSTGERGASRYY
jgi:hypothetical protein